MKRTGIVSIGIVLMLLAPTALAVDETDLRQEVSDFRAVVDDAVLRYREAYANHTAGNVTAAEAEMKAASRMVGGAFIRFEQGHYDAESLSTFMQTRMPGSYYRTFEQHVVLLAGILKPDGTPTDPATVQGQANQVHTALDRVESCIPEGCGNGFGPGAQAFVVLLREGFEAILVIGAVVAFLRKSDRPDRIPVVYGGAWAALGASVVTWFAVAFLFDFSAERQIVSREILEGVSMLLAAAVLFYVSYWLLSKVEARKWQAFLEGRIQQSLATNRAWALGLLAFLAVYREGFETVLFYQGLLARAGSGTGGILVGTALALVALVVIYYMVHAAGVRLPLRKFFLASSAILYFLAFRFAGQGVFELQEAGLVAVTPLTAVVGFLAAHPLWSGLLTGGLGFVPTLEVAITQGVLLLALVGGAAYTWWGRFRFTAPRDVGNAP